MNTYIIACETLKEELEKAIAETQCTYPVLFIESGLHDVPKKLKKVLQDTIDEAESRGAERLLFVMGFCGNATQGIRPGKSTLIIPRVDDCITLLLGSQKRRKQLQESGGTYFMTKGWVDGERNILSMRQYMMERYGEDAGEEIFNMMFGNYSRIGLLDTGAYDMEPVTEQVKQAAEAIGFRWEIFRASVDYIKETLTGPWEDDRYLTVPPGREVEGKDLWIIN
ncbi:MAG: DUF1638 domain-containing protein [Lachnospiraceae bacterium]|nr:DUF1638 domain-containing protein [Lachnospiraceae bacterium]